MVVCVCVWVGGGSRRVAVSNWLLMASAFGGVWSLLQYGHRYSMVTATVCVSICAWHETAACQGKGRSLCQKKSEL